MNPMTHTSALNIPQSGPTASRYAVAIFDVIAGIQAVGIWGRLGWRENKRRYRRTVFGPFWTTVSLAMFVVALCLVWSNLWHNDPKAYLPFLTSGMLCWVLFSTICNDGCAGFVGSEALIKQVRISYTLLACATVWRNVIVFFHNLSVFVLICIYAGVSITWATLLTVPGLLLLSINGLWVAILLGVVCARYRDVQQLVSNLLQISLFLTPIFWSADQLTGRASMLADYNPLYHLIAIVRDPLLGQAPAALHWIIVAIMAVLGWAFTIYLMGKFRHRIAYWL
jgi:ABC-type polysaccharide/polyol phosphate export permease